ncbi:MAG: 2-C-methyl-D-erythritol 4-phosphate cytidylyltransferase [Bacteroidales bacterium]|nr:2-C-methyl-D-erythritol 4-phosphate cytidylyltransferase [Bacteroidales bacterium]
MDCHAIILAGGVGSRMKSEIPKQYLPVKDTPLFVYSVRKFAADARIKTIVLVVAAQWRSFVQETLEKETIAQKVIYAASGASRQHSVRSGLEALASIASKDDLVFVHDSVRPLFPVSIIDDSIAGCTTADMTLPVISVKDATYRSVDGDNLTAILPRTELYSGQSPECLKYGAFMKAQAQFSEDEIAAIRGCSELAFRAGLKVKLISGAEQNFKITTAEDMQALTLIL